MNVPRSIEGLILGPVFALTVFFLKLTCPVKTGEGCFADLFFRIIFLPLPLLYKVFESNPVWIAKNEILILLLYWSLIGFLIGLANDVRKKS